MLLSQTQTQDLVERIVSAVHPRRIILFGSSARGQRHGHSDVDVLVLAEEGAHRRKTEQAIYRRLVGFGLPVDVIVATPSDLEAYQDSPGLIYREALRDGKELYAA